MDDIKIIKNTALPSATIIRDRIHIQIPASHFIPNDILCNQIQNIYDCNIIREHLSNEGQLTIYQVSQICHNSDILTSKEENLIRLKSKTKIIGDIHGQFYDLLYILKDCDLNNEKIIFLGDYVDRGVFSTEVYLYLLCLKIKYPNNLYLLRGNHESEKMTSYFTFKQECLFKYNLQVYQMFLKSFQNLPLAAIVNEAFCCHGGISPNLIFVDEINKIDRFNEVPYTGLFCDLLWADPNPKFDSKKKFARNKQRNCSYFYSKIAVCNFLAFNNLKRIIRGHEVQQQGYNVLTKDQNLVITIFSAPNYCDMYANTGAYIIYDTSITVIKFNASKHPFYLPNYLDGINWSFPLISEKIGEFYLDILRYTDKDDEDVEGFINNMILLRNERECISEMDEESTELPCCKLKNIDKDVSYDEAKSTDSDNEKYKINEEISNEHSSSCSNVIVKSMESDSVDNSVKNMMVEVDETRGVLKVKINPTKNKKRKRSLTKNIN